MSTLAIISSVAFILFLLMASFGKGSTRTLGFILAGALGLAIGFGLIKGFGRVIYGPLNVNGGKLLIGACLALLLPSALRWNKACWLWWGLALTLLPLAAWYFGLARLHPQVSMAVLWFAVNNLVTCIAEDFYFRRFVQDHLKGLGTPFEVLLTAALFGLVHLPGGHLFALLAFAAGIAYSATYRASGNSVWAVTGVHWSVNIARAVLFGVP
jgi:membrane protease YdiL (CAAX protease family)